MKTRVYAKNNWSRRLVTLCNVIDFRWRIWHRWPKYFQCCTRSSLSLPLCVCDFEEPPKCYEQALNNVINFRWRMWNRWPKWFQISPFLCVRDFEALGYPLYRNVENKNRLNELTEGRRGKLRPSLETEILRPKVLGLNLKWAAVFGL